MLLLENNDRSGNGSHRCGRQTIGMSRQANLYSTVIVSSRQVRSKRNKGNRLGMICQTVIRFKKTTPFSQKDSSLLKKRSCFTLCLFASFFEKSGVKGQCPLHQSLSLISSSPQRPLPWRQCSQESSRTVQGEQEPYRNGRRCPRHQREAPARGKPR